MDCPSRRQRILPEWNSPAQQSRQHRPRDCLKHAANPGPCCSWPRACSQSPAAARPTQEMSRAHDGRQTDRLRSGKGWGETLWAGNGLCLYQNVASRVCVHCGCQPAVPDGGFGVWDRRVFRAQDGMGCVPAANVWDIWSSLQSVRLGLSWARSQTQFQTSIFSLATTWIPLCVRRQERTRSNDESQLCKSQCTSTHPLTRFTQERRFRKRKGWRKNKGLSRRLSFKLASGNPANFRTGNAFGVLLRERFGDVLMAQIFTEYSLG